MFIDKPSLDYQLIASKLRLQVHLNHLVFIKVNSRSCTSRSFTRLRPGKQLTKKRKQSFNQKRYWTYFATDLDVIDDKLYVMKNKSHDQFKQEQKLLV
jgi:hypothetical protein